MNKAQIKVSGFLIGLAVCAILITGGVWFLVDIQNSGYTIGNDGSGLNAELNSLQNLTTSIQNQTANAKIDESSIFVTASQGAITATKLASGGLNIFERLLNNISSLLGIPGWAFAGATLLISLLFLFAIISAMQRWNT